MNGAPDGTGRDRIAVLGGGAWGTALATLQARASRTTCLYARDDETVEAIRATGFNPRYLPGVPLAPSLAATSDLGEALAGASLVLLVIPAQSLAEIGPAVAAHLSPSVPVVLCAKGIERGTGRFATGVVAESLPGQPLAVLSGPSFAEDVARGLPTAVTLAAASETLAADLSRRLSTESFRPYASGDVVGVEAGGALKNVLALAAGAVAGRGLGASAGAAIVTRGFVELRRLGEALGARPETLMGLSGLGDLVLTCSGTQSRNFAYGLALGRGDDLTGLKLAEGVHSAAMAAQLAEERGIEAPIIFAVAEILAGRLRVEEAVRDLLARPLKREFD
ncbi:MULTISPECIES: NAD(P)H-dependent glycerol-3-phosphate dehydrogenase [unclassified Aureimonas]|uniref:NAD(P)H-dependent glycerol-3-phosphate dehydrogenase n=1 Tax=unclassified Aureimonas TaxID=2615206 RepID=UPI0006FD8AD9|nr:MULTISPECIES: NAD(P)H-dependent glycerol-3-phosphate dehydrogenase [unclassified Aureimonas]KQT61848.1 glycerol-3-phosphate dehydrogenase [Aureimonas sp. Leaf427]KQT74880.1 glycerol-3-phosphate dehydrogenase [Aureimonas sp. Leaf460]